MEVMVFISNPKDFASWPREQKLERLRLVMDWHEQAEAMSGDAAPFMWGSHQVLSQIALSELTDLRIIVHRVESLRELDERLSNDPLRLYSRYKTVLLTPLQNDREDDFKRLELSRNALFEKADDSAKAEISKSLSHFKAAPSFVGKYQPATPENPIVPYSSSSIMKEDERPVRVLIHGMNPPEYMAWDDLRKLAHYEKVIWWHDHIADMQEKGMLSHVWGTHDFCAADTMSYRSASGATVYKAKSLDEFDEIYRLDPLRDHGHFWSVILKGMDYQRLDDEAMLKQLGG